MKFSLSLRFAYSFLFTLFIYFGTFGVASHIEDLGIVEDVLGLQLFFRMSNYILIARKLHPGVFLIFAMAY